MAKNDPVQPIVQGECTECGKSEDNFNVEERDYNYFDDHEDVEQGIRYALKCDCGETAAVAITTEGMFSGGPISHENASWNEEQDDE